MNAETQRSRENKTRILLFSAHLLLCVSALIFPGAASAQITNKKVVGYFAGWSPRYSAADIPADKLTHVNYAFAVIRDGEIFARNAEEKFAQLRQLKQKHPHLRTLISIGGWSGSAGFSDAALTDESRRRFAASCAAFIEKHGFDGVDIDWEYPAARGHANATTRPQDTQNFTLLLAELRRQLGPRRLLTIAAPAGSYQLARIQIDQIVPLLDWINLMTYDYAGEWNVTTGLNAPLYGTPENPIENPKAVPHLNADFTVQLYLRHVPPRKLLLGVPFYARAWGGVKDVNHGLFVRHAGKTPSAPELGGWSYRTVCAHYLDKGARRFWHDKAKVPWLYDVEKQITISYDDPQSIRLKAEYARDQDLGGVMIWELSHDEARSSLLNAVVEGLTPSASTQRASL